MGSRFRYYRYHRYHMSMMSGPRLSLWKQRSFGKRSGDTEIKVTLLGRRDGTTCPKWVAARLHRCRCQPDTVSGWYGWYEIRCRWRICWRSCGLWMKICRPTRLRVKATLSFEAMFLWAMSAGWQYDQLWGVAKVLQGRALIRCKHTSGELAVENHSELFLLILVYLDFFRWGCWCQNPIVLGRRVIETWFCMASVLLGAMLVSPKTSKNHAPSRRATKHDKAIPLVPRKPHNHTISVTEAQRISAGRVRALPLCLARSDLAFIGGYHGLVDLRVGEIDRIRGPTQSRREPACDPLRSDWWFTFHPCLR